MTFCDCQIRSIAKSCTPNSTSFSMHALRRMAGSTETINQQVRRTAHCAWQAHQPQPPSGSLLVS